MSSQVAICFRFPNGMREFTSRDVAPAVGDMLTFGTEEWEVVAVETNGGGDVFVKLDLPSRANGSGIGPVASGTEG